MRVAGTEQVGPYTLLRVVAGPVEPGIPGQFFMLHPPGHVLPRPMSLCLAGSGELGFLIDPIGPGTRTLCALEAGETLHVLGPLGNGFDLSMHRRDCTDALWAATLAANKGPGQWYADADSLRYSFFDKVESDD